MEEDMLKPPRRKKKESNNKKKKKYNNENVGGVVDNATGTQWWCWINRIRMVRNGLCWLLPANGNPGWKPGIEIRNGDSEWRPRMETQNGDPEWRPRMGPFELIHNSRAARFDAAFCPLCRLKEAQQNEQMPSIPLSHTHTHIYTYSAI